MKLYFSGRVQPLPPIWGAHTPSLYDRAIGQWAKVCIIHDLAIVQPPIPTNPLPEGIPTSSQGVAELIAPQLMAYIDNLRGNLL